MNFTTPRHTPWGSPDNQTQIASGIVRFDTPSHGGLWVRPDLNAKIPDKYKKASFGQQGLQGWYEEDCDWCIVALVFEAEYRAYCDKYGMDADACIAGAKQTFNGWIQPNIDKLSGNEVLF